MNNKILEIKQQAHSTIKAKEELDTEKDEYTVEHLLQPYGTWSNTNSKDKWCRWDAEGIDPSGTNAKLEVKSRAGNMDKYDTWIIDSYKIDYLLENHPDENHYFVNVYKGGYHLYDARFVADCPKKVRKVRGDKKLHTFYYIPKDMFMVELASGKLGDGSELNKTFNT